MLGTDPALRAPASRSDASGGGGAGLRPAGVAAGRGVRRNDQSLLPTKLIGVTSTIAIAWATTLPSPAATSAARISFVRGEGDQRDDEEAESLVGDVPALPAERPEPVPGVVVRDRDEERDRGGDAVVVAAVDEQGVDGEVDGVAAGADDAELRELHPVVRRAQGPAGAGTARVRRRSSSAPSACEPTGRAVAAVRRRARPRARRERARRRPRTRRRTPRSPRRRKRPRRAARPRSLPPAATCVPFSVRSELVRPR